MFRSSYDREFEREQEIEHEAYRRGASNVLDKIRAEIEDLTYYCCEVHPRYVIDDVLKIIDKYKVESEE